MKHSHTDTYWMRRALELGRKGVGSTSPNPRVGAVVVKNGRILGEGFHRQAGLDHAEVIALRKAKRRGRGATLYVTLEPCAHFGRTPPCVNAVLESGIKRVVIAGKDPNPVTDGRGIRILRKNGIKVKTGILGREAAALNLPYRKWMKRKIPYVTLKIAQSLDGKIATAGGESRWISSPKSRRFAQSLRRAADAVLVGIRTVLRDDPRLSVRGRGRKALVKIILDSSLRLPEKASLFKTPGQVIVATTRHSPAAKRRRLGRLADLILAPEGNGGVDLLFLLRKLGKRGILHVLVEGGGEVVASFVEKGLADEAYFFIAPLIIGGRRSPTSIEGEGIGDLKRVWRLKKPEVLKSGPDILVHGYF